MKMSEIFLMLSILTLVFCCESHQQTSPFRALVEAERAFARLSADSGMRAAFMTYLADNSIVFRPEPVNGKERYSGAPIIPGMLIWQPGQADISRDGMMGYTTGPWEFRREGIEDTVAGYGQYVSVWKKQPDGLWRVVIDVGISHPSPGYDLRDTLLAVTSPFVVPDQPVLPPGVKQEITIAETDRSFSEFASEYGWREAFLRFASPGVMLYRDGMFLLSRIDAIQDILPAMAGSTSWKFLGTGVAESGDLGYSYGFIDHLPGQTDTSRMEKSSYLRIWKRNPAGEWKMELEITNLISEPSD